MPVTIRTRSAKSVKSTCATIESQIAATAQSAVASLHPTTLIPKSIQLRLQLQFPHPICLMWRHGRLGWRTKSTLTGAALDAYLGTAFVERYATVSSAALKVNVY